MMRTLTVLALLGLFGCAAPPPPAGPPAGSPPPYTPGTVAPLPEDTCGLKAVSHLIGRPRTEIPVPVDPGRQRVACTTCPITYDYSPGRLNFFYDADTGIIREIRCG